MSRESLVDGGASVRHTEASSDRCPPVAAIRLRMAKLRIGLRLYPQKLKRVVATPSSSNSSPLQFFFKSGILWALTKCSDIVYNIRHKRPSGPVCLCPCAAVLLGDSQRRGIVPILSGKRNACASADALRRLTTSAFIRVHPRC